MSEFLYGHTDEFCVGKNCKHYQSISSCGGAICFNYGACKAEKCVH